MITLGIAINSPLLKAGVKALISHNNNFELVFEASDGEQLLQQTLFSKKLLDILVLDTHLHKPTGVTILRELKKCFHNKK